MSTIAPAAGPTTHHAPRLRAPSWKDPRLVVGIVLVLLSVLLGTWAVGARDTTAPVWVASTTLVPGDGVVRAGLREVRVHLGGSTAGYLRADRPLPPHLVALRVVGAGELLPRAAVGAADRLDRRPVGLSVTGPLASGIVKGAAVDVWVSLPTTAAGTSAAGRFAPPRRLAAAAGVFEVSTARAALASDGASTVQVLLAPAALRDALGAQASGGRVALVLVPGSSPAKG